MCSWQHIDFLIYSPDICPGDINGIDNVIKHVCQDLNCRMSDDRFTRGVYIDLEYFRKVEVHFLSSILCSDGV